MKIFTSYFAKVDELQDRGFVTISIARKPPYWFNGERLPQLAPPTWLMKYAETQYRPYFKTEVLDKCDVERAIKYFEDHYSNKNVVLLCYEKPGSFCHRHMVADWLNEAGMDVQEYGVQTKLSFPKSTYKEKWHTKPQI